MKYSEKDGGKIAQRMLLFATIMILGIACDNGCNDCLDLSSKNIRVVDSFGNDLLFGNEAIYDPESVIIKETDGEPQPIFVDESTNTLQFFLESDVAQYSLVLSEGEVDTLSFELAEQKSERCCGMKTISINTSLNGNRIENSDIITIVK